MAAQPVLFPVGPNTNNVPCSMRLPQTTSDTVANTVTFVNLDSTNTVTINGTNSVTVGGQGIALGPGASIQVPTSSAWFAVAPAGTSPMLVAPGAANYTAPTLITGPVTISGIVDVTGSVSITGTVPVTIGGTVAVSITGANTIQVTGNVNVIGSGGFIPLGQTSALIQLGSISNVSPTDIPAGTGYQVMNLVDVSTYTSYELALYVYGSAGAAGGSATHQVILQWFDDTVSGIPVYQEDWYPLSGGGVFAGSLSGNLGQPNNPLCGSGPMHGHYMSMFVNNPGTADKKIQWCNVFGSGRPLNYSSWRENGAMPGGTAIQGTTVIANSIGETYENHPAGLNAWSPPVAGTIYFLPLGMYAGPVSFLYEVITTTLTHDPTIVDLSTVTGGSLSAGIGQVGVVADFGNTLNNIEQVIINLPRAACALVMEGPVTSVVNFSMVTQQGY